jgi:hypothetical protein
MHAGSYQACADASGYAASMSASPIYSTRACQPPFRHPLSWKRDYCIQIYSSPPALQIELVDQSGKHHLGIQALKRQREIWNTPAMRTVRIGSELAPGANVIMIPWR